MRVLLIGEYSKLHWTLAEGLRRLGHEVTVASSGDGWKNYPRDINIGYSNKTEALKVFRKLLLTSAFKGYDVVQVINFAFMFGPKRDTFNHWFLRYLKRHNGKVFLGAFGDDYFWVKACMDGRFRYTQFSQNTPAMLADPHYQEALKLLSPVAERSNTYVAERCDGIIAGAYEYYKAYEHTPFAGKLHYIPFPINTEDHVFKKNEVDASNKVKFFVGIQVSRNAWKGTDVLLSELTRFCAKYPNSTEMSIAQSVPYETYVKMYEGSNVLIDQLYSYSVAMNALTAMTGGKIIIGGGEPEMYEFVNETENKPVINVIPDPHQIQQQFEYVMDNRANFGQMAVAGRSYVEKHHHFVSVASQYAEIWEAGRI